MVKAYKKELVDGKIKIGVWGIGFIGYTTLVHFANKGIHGIGVDIDENLVNIANNGEIPLVGLEYWLGFPVKNLFEENLIQATNDWKILIEDPEIQIHFISIPTEKGAEPWDDALIDVIEKISKRKFNDPTIIIIESTLTPGRCDQVVIKSLEDKGHVVGKDFLVAVAPRRDWFISPDKSLEKLPRVVGGSTPETTEVIINILSIICENLIPAKSHREAELVKSTENAFRHVGITLANQLAVAFPDVDMREVLRLVGTKWNIETYIPSLGTGGYCIPLSSKYVLLGAKNPEHLSILKDTIEFDMNQPQNIAEIIHKHYKCKKIGMLGIAYKGDLKVYILSPALRIIDYFKKNNIEVIANDPYYTDEEIKNIAGIKSFKFPDGLKQFDCIIITPDHRLYQRISKDKLEEVLINCKVIIDNAGVWRKWSEVFEKKQIKYIEIGSKNWNSL